jgi:hypothetical protein
VGNLRASEVQDLLDDHGKHSAADVVAKAQAVLSESELLRAMFDVGYFPPNTPPPVEQMPVAAISRPSDKRRPADRTLSWAIFVTVGGPRSPKQPRQHQC